MKLKLIFASIVVASSFFIPSVSANEIEKAIKKNYSSEAATRIAYRRVTASFPERKISP